MSNGVLISKDLALKTKTFMEGVNSVPVKTPNKSVSSGFGNFVSPVELTADWINEDGLGWKAKMKRLWFIEESGEYHINNEDNEDSETDIYYPLSLDKPKGSSGTRCFAIYRGRWEVIVFGEVGESGAKELFPAVVYQVSDNETYIICPGGRDEERSVKTVHVLHIENRRVSTSLFGSLPMAMSNFDAKIINDMLVCAPGEVESGTKYPVQRYNFETEQWTKTDTTTSLSGCPAYVKDGLLIIAGGQSAYYVSIQKPLAGGGNIGAIQQYGHNASLIWQIDPLSGILNLRTPIRLFRESGGDEPTEVSKQKKFLKQNFSGIHYEHIDNGKPVEFVAVGGDEMMGYQSKAVVSYAMDSSGALLNCEHNTEATTYDDCEVFPDTPIPLGECDAVRINNYLACFGGRYKTDEDIIARDENGNIAYDEDGKKIILYRKDEYVPHKKVWTLDLTKKVWEDNRCPEIPTPRWNAALSEVVTTKEEIIDNENKPTGRFKTVSRVFLIGGRIDNRSVEKVEIKDDNGNVTKKYHKLVIKQGLTGSIEAYNVNTNTWETDFPHL